MNNTMAGKDNRRSKSTNVSGLFIRDFNAVREIMRSIYLFGCYDKNDYINREGVLKFKTGTSEGNISRSKVEIEIARFQFLLGENFFNANDDTYHCTYSLHDRQDDTMLAMYRNHTFTRLNLQSYLLLLQILNEADEEGIKTMDFFKRINQAHGLAVDEAGSDEEVSVGNLEPNFYLIAKSKLQTELDTLKELGFIEERVVDKRTNAYVLTEDIFKDFTVEELEKIYHFLEFCSRSMSIQAPFYFAKKKMDLYIKYEKGYKEDISTSFLYRHNFIYNSLDNEIALAILKGIKSRKVVEIEVYYRDMLVKDDVGQMKKVRVVPVKIVHDLWTGKQDLLYYNLETKKAETYRLDLIYLARLKDDVTAKMWEHAVKECDAIYHTWRTFLRSPYGPETAKIRFSIPKSDKVNRHRVLFEGVEDHGGTVREEGSDLIYEIEQLDVDDMLTWICSFGELATVLEPQHLAENVQRVWQMTLEQNDETKPLIQKGERFEYNPVVVNSKEDLDQIIFTKENNFMYEAMTRLINEKVDQQENSVKESEITEMVSLALGRDIQKEVLFFDNNEHKYYDLLAEGGTKTKKDEKERTYFIRVFKKVPIRFSVLEKEAIINAVTLPQARYFLDKELTDKILKVLPEDQVSWSIHDVLLKNRRDFGDEREESLKNVSLLQTAIHTKQCVKCSLHLGGKVQKDIAIYPMAMDYYAAQDKINLILYDEKKDFMFPADLNEITDVKLIGKEKVLFDRFMKWREETYVPATFQIAPKKFAVDRIVRMFSHYQRNVEFDPKTDIYTMQIEYNKADDLVLQRDILSAGEYIRVLEDKNLRQGIQKRIEQATKNYQKTKGGKK